jgi:hypothetical protein
MKTVVICVFLSLLSSCALDVGSLTQQVGTCVSDPIAPGSGDGDVVPQCPPPPGLPAATANALASAVNRVHAVLSVPPPSVTCNGDLQSCSTLFWLDDFTYLSTTCGYAIPITCSTDEFADIDGWFVIILSF